MFDKLYSHFYICICSNYNNMRFVVDYFNSTRQIPAYFIASFHPLFVFLVRPASTSDPVTGSPRLYSPAGYPDDRPSKGFAWVGATNTRLSLSPRAIQTLTLKACFAECGVYDVSRVRISTAVPRLDDTPTNQNRGGTGDSDLVVQRALSASLITVVEPNKKN